ncbi:MAG: hypothetical protein JWO83_867 [Caulobacteraceae bacterium]|jgi:hypothetical protein|nr:hypothetical protein [Caulobacteraceae bacterium]
MSKPLVALALATSLVGSSAVVAQAQPLPQTGLIFGVDRASDRPALDPVQFVWAGRNYCWYDGGWHGPGWYWCGNPWRRGYGWGGPYGWHGWRGGREWRGGHYGRGDWHGHEGGWRGHEGGRHGGDHEHGHR